MVEVCRALSDIWNSGLTMGKSSCRAFQHHSEWVRFEQHLRGFVPNARIQIIDPVMPQIRYPIGSDFVILADTVIV